MPDLCFIHAHHRSKNAVKGLRPHLMKHFSIASLNRQPTNLQHMIHNIETSLVMDPFLRVTAPPPADALTLSDVAHILFNLDGSFHERASGKSQRAQDIVRICGLLNGDIRGGSHPLLSQHGEWTAVLHECQ